MPSVDIEYNETSPIPANFDGVSDSLFLKSFRFGSLTIIKSGTDGNPIINIEGSNDNINFSNAYVDINQNPDTFELVDDVNQVDITDFYHEYFAIRFDSNGTTTGTITINMFYE